MQNFLNKLQIIIMLRKYIEDKDFKHINEDMHLAQFDKMNVS